MFIIEQLFQNKIIWTAVIGWVVAQSIKIFIEFIEKKKINFNLLFASGGMPSSHTAFVTSMSVAVGLEESFSSAIFAVSFIVSCIVMYDAAGVRRAAGKQAAILNIIMNDLAKKGVRIGEKLKELLGHSPIEVVMGAILGISVACILH